LCTIVIVHNTVAQRQFLFIFPFLQTNITSQMWPAGGKGSRTWTEEQIKNAWPNKRQDTDELSGLIKQ